MVICYCNAVSTYMALGSGHQAENKEVKLVQINAQQPIAYG